jgi:hypothetical protein
MTKKERATLQEFDEVEFEGAIYEVERVEADGGMWLSPAPP